MLFMRSQDPSAAGTRQCCAHVLWKARKTVLGNNFILMLVKADLRWHEMHKPEIVIDVLHMLADHHKGRLSTSKSGTQA